MELEGAYCYESYKSGDLRIYICPPATTAQIVVKSGDPIELVIPGDDVRRLVNAALDALSKEQARY